jgi:hypothetical protein
MYVMRFYYNLLQRASAKVSNFSLSNIHRTTTVYSIHHTGYAVITLMSMNKRSQKNINGFSPVR